MISLPQYKHSLLVTISQQQCAISVSIRAKNLSLFVVIRFCLHCASSLIHYRLSIQPNHEQTTGYWHLGLLLTTKRFVDMFLSCIFSSYSNCTFMVRHGQYKLTDNQFKLSILWNSNGQMRTTGKDNRN